ncbi:restriction endonuclease [Streptomyces sp. TRM49041]|uniref:restriction endonuclease n=1 Tax=Streptomyces sp. TRM49041 TaxID=2603216 RepID=UPI0011ED4FAE|nr:restriction endonuclease [Streptomyces sp. TRM49041]
MARRRLRPRMPRGAGEWAAAAVVALAAVTLATKTAVAIAVAAQQAWPVLVALAAAGLLCAGWRAWRSARAARMRAQSLARLRITLMQIDAMDDQDFEFVLRDLLIRDGWSARRVGRQGDQAADAIGQHGRRGRIVLQAKHTTVGAKVGVHVMYQVKGTAGPVHGADHAVVVTNGTFTRDARAWGEKHQIHWIDRDRLRTWAEHGAPLHDLLRLPDRRPRRALAPRTIRPRSSIT